MEDVKFSCPHCQQSLEAPEELMGQVIECPSCNGRIELQPPPKQTVEVRMPTLPSSGKKQILVKRRQANPATPSSSPEQVRSKPHSPDKGSYASEKMGRAKGLLGGLGMMVIASVWFVAGYYAGYIYFYPPILFIVGLYCTVKGIVKSASPSRK